MCYQYEFPYTVQKDYLEHPHNSVICVNDSGNVAKVSCLVKSLLSHAWQSRGPTDQAPLAKFQSELQLWLLRS